VTVLGDPLFAVAALDGWMLELRIGEADVGDVRAELVGRFAPLARPEQPQSFSISRIRPQAEIQGQLNVYVAEAEAALPFAWMRPGMEGVAKIEVGRRRVWWVVLHRATDYLRLKLWL